MKGKEITSSSLPKITVFTGRAADSAGAIFNGRDRNNREGYKECQVMGC